MKKFTLLLLLLVFAYPAITNAAVHYPTPTISDIQANSPEALISQMDAEAILALKPSDVQAQTGQKMKLADRVALRLTQHQVRRAMKKGESLDMGAYYEDARGNFSIGGFLLGFFFSLIGVLIAILFGGNAFRSALLGALCGLLVVLIAVLV